VQNPALAQKEKGEHLTGLKKETASAGTSVIIGDLNRQICKDPGKEVCKQKRGWISSGASRTPGARRTLRKMAPET